MCSDKNIARVELRHEALTDCISRGRKRKLLFVFLRPTHYPSKTHLESLIPPDVTKILLYGTRKVVAKRRTH